MKTTRRLLMALLALSAPVWAQAKGELPKTSKPAAEAPPDKADKADKGKKASKPKPSPTARAALQAAKDLANAVKGQDGVARMAALQAAAQAYEKVALDFAAEPVSAAQALFSAGDLWRRHGSLAQAEKDYLGAAALDAPTYGQRATLEAADMQRLQKQSEKAIASYAQVVAFDANTTRAQDARLWTGRILLSLGKVDEAVTAFQAALESAQRPRQVIEAANFLAKAFLQKGDFDAAEKAIEHAETSVAGAGETDEVEQERLQKALAEMSSRKALQRGKDKQNKAGKDARALDESKAEKKPSQGSGN